MKVKKGKKECVLCATITMSPRGEEYNHYGIKRSLPTTITNVLSQVLDQRYGVKRKEERHQMLLGQRRHKKKANSK
jgi:hypothetical protein